MSRIDERIADPFLRHCLWRDAFTALASSALRVVTHLDGVRCPPHLTLLFCDALATVGNNALTSLSLDVVSSDALTTLGHWLCANTSLQSLTVQTLSVLRLELEQFILTIYDFNFTLCYLSWSSLALPRQARFSARNIDLRWQVVHKVILETVVAMAPLALPAYVLLWIIDWLPDYDKVHGALKKVSLIQSIIESTRRVLAARGASVKK